MAKSMSRGVKNGIRKKVDTIEGAIRRSRRNRGVSKKKIAAAAGAALAGAAWFARSRRTGNGAGNGLTLHVLPEEEGWVVKKEGSDEAKTFGTKKKAIAAGREQAASSAPSNLVIHRRDGSVELSHAYGTD